MRGGVEIHYKAITRDTEMLVATTKDCCSHIHSICVHSHLNVGLEVKQVYTLPIAAIQSK